MPPRSRGPPLNLSLLPALLKPSPRLPSHRLICPNCFSSPRPFSSTPTRPKKSSASTKSARKTPDIPITKPARSIPDNAKTAAKDASIDPYDYTDLEAAIAKAVARLQEALTKTRDAGRVSAQMIEDLPVDLGVKGSGSSSGGSGGGAQKDKDRTRIGDIASVVPKGGRSMSVFAAEESHVKPLVSAIQASSYSLTPAAPNQNDANPLVITVPVPPVTAETRAQAAAEAKKCMEKASVEVKNARGEAQKRYRRMELGKLVIVDEIRKGHKGMEEVVKKGQEEVKRVGENAIKALER